MDKKMIPLREVDKIRPGYDPTVKTEKLIVISQSAPKKSIPEKIEVWFNKALGKK